MYDHTFYKQVQISRSDMRPHKKWAVSLVILHMITSIFLWALCGYIWVNILTGDGGSRVGEVRAGTTFPMPEHDNNGALKIDPKLFVSWYQRFGLYYLMTPGLSKDILCHV